MLSTFLFLVFNFFKNEFNKKKNLRSFDIFLPIQLRLLWELLSTKFFLLRKKLFHSFWSCKEFYNSILKTKTFPCLLFVCFFNTPLCCLCRKEKEKKWPFFFEKQRRRQFFSIFFSDKQQSVESKIILVTLKLLIVIK